MADYDINAVTRRQVFSGSAGTGPYSFTFEVLDANDLAVYKNATKLTITTDYTVTVNANGTGDVTLVVAATSSDNITIIGARDIERTTDFVTAGDLRASALNEQLDGQIIMIQQIAEESKRQLTAPVQDPEHTDDGGTLDMTLPAKDDRKGKYLAFNATTGNPEAGPSTTNVNTLAAITDDIATLADIEDGTDATDAIQDVAGIAGNVTTVAGVASNVTTVATNISDVNTVVTNITDIQNAEEHAQEAKDYATKTDGQVQENGANSGNYSSKAWATGGTGVTDTSGAGAAKEWAVDQSADGVDGTEYSAKEYAIGSTAGNTNGSAKQWALGGGSSYSSNTTVDGSNYSARYWAEQAAASADSVDDIYLGAKSSAPTLDNDGNALQVGALYFNNSSNDLFVWNGTSWQVTAVTASGFATAGFSIAMSIAL